MRRGLGERRGEPGDEPAAAERGDDGPDVGHLLEDLERDGRLARDDVGVVERVDEHGARAVGLGARGGERLVHVGADEPDLGAVLARRRDLGERGVDRHVHDGPDAEQSRGERDALGVVAALAATTPRAFSSALRRAMRT